MNQAFVLDFLLIQKSVESLQAYYSGGDYLHNIIECKQYHPLKRKKNICKKLLYKVFTKHYAFVLQKSTQFFYGQLMYVYEIWAYTIHPSNEIILPTKVTNKVHQNVDKLIII